jgi:hypothetical protein
MYITDKQNKGLFVFDTVFTIIWITLSGSPENGPDKESIENKCPLFYVYLSFDVYKIITTSCQAFYCTNEKGKCEKIFLL